MNASRSPLNGLFRATVNAAALMVFLNLALLAKPNGLPRSTPEKQGVSSAALLDFVEALDRLGGLHSVMVLRHGHMIAEGWWAPYDPTSNHELYSLSKSFTSTAVGFAVAEGRLSVDDPVLKFFPDLVPAEPSANLKAMRVRDILSMSTGHQDEPPTAPDKVSAASFLAASVPHKPGTHFKYNTAATFMQSAIVQKLTGQTVLDYLQPRLFEPLGIAHPVWRSNFEGISLGGYGLRVRTEDIARLGQLYLQRGRWQGKQLLPAEWVDAASSKQVSNGSNPKSDWDQGYGYQFWRCQNGAYRGDGAFGQYCVVMPQQDAVLAITSGVGDMQAVLNVAWDKLLPAFQKNRSSNAKVNQSRLGAKLASLSIPTPQGLATSVHASRRMGLRYAFPFNEHGLESITAESDPAGGWVMVCQTRGETTRIPCGYQSWKRDRGSFGMLSNEPLAAAAAWTDDDTLQVHLCGTETPFQFQIELRFEGNQVQCTWKPNVGFGGTKPVKLTGTVTQG